MNINHWPDDWRQMHSDVRGREIYHESITISAAHIQLHSYAAMLLQVSLGRAPAGSAVPSAVNDEMSSQVGASALLLITVVYIDGTA